MAQWCQGLGINSYSVVFGYGNKIENDLRSRAWHKTEKETPIALRPCAGGINTTTTTTDALGGYTKKKLGANVIYIDFEANYLVAKATPFSMFLDNWSMATSNNFFSSSLAFSKTSY